MDWVKVNFAGEALEIAVRADNANQLIVVPIGLVSELQRELAAALMVYEAIGGKR